MPAFVVEPMQRPVHACIVNGAEEIAGLKRVCDEVAGGDGGASGCGLMSGVSTNDVTCAELVCSLGLEDERVPVTMIMEYRGLVGATNVFSDMWTTAEFYPRNSLAAAADIRKSLKHAQSRDFLEWHLGQSFGGMRLASRREGLPLFPSPVLPSPTTWAQQRSVQATRREHCSTEYA